MKKQELNVLKSELQNQDWFAGVEEKDNKIIVYSKQLDSNTLKYIPETINSYPVLVHYASSIFEKSKYVNIISRPQDEDDINIEVLRSEVQALLMKYNKDIVENIMFEVHDGEEAITNLSLYYPVVKDKIEQLYNIFGFDNFYQELIF